MATALIEAKQVMTGAVGELLAKTGEETQGVHTPADAIHTLLHTQLSGAQLQSPPPPTNTHCDAPLYLQVFAPVTLTFL
jgi:hypothetical protein